MVITFFVLGVYIAKMGGNWSVGIAGPAKYEIVHLLRLARSLHTVCSDRLELFIRVGRTVSPTHPTDLTKQSRRAEPKVDEIYMLIRQLCSRAAGVWAD